MKINIMTLQSTKTVRELALEIPGATRIFEKLGIDYCCGGGKSLEQACAARALSTQDVILKLEEEVEKPATLEADSAADVSSMTLTGLTAYIIDKHHVFTRHELVRLDALMNKVCSVHGQNHKELLGLQSLLRELSADLSPHMLKEEMVLFPYIVRMEEAARDDRASFVPPPFMTVRNPVRMMSLEHDTAGDLLRRMREASADYAVPGDACISYRTLYQALEELERDLHQHIHLENNILFPRAIAMEDALNARQHS
jgi:regulator of cell morphogenesis and NO signaling